MTVYTLNLLKHSILSGGKERRYSSLLEESK